MANHNHSRDSLSYIRSRQVWESYEDAKAREYQWEDSIIWIDFPPEYYKNSYNQNIISILSNPEIIIAYIMPIKNSLEKIIFKVCKGTYFEVWWVLFQVVEMPILDWWFVEAKEVFSRNPENISLTQSFSLQNVSRNMIPDTEAIDRMKQHISLSLRKKQSKYIESIYG